MTDICYGREENNIPKVLNYGARGNGMLEDPSKDRLAKAMVMVMEHAIIFNS
jgi:hypothetical protein